MHRCLPEALQDQGHLKDQLVLQPLMVLHRPEPLEDQLGLRSLRDPADLEVLPDLAVLSLP